MKKKYHHGDLRRKLIETALQIISEQGLEKVTMRELGKRLEVSRTAPYRHFSDKSALLCAIAEEGYKKLSTIIGQINEQNTDDPLIRIQNVGVAYVKFALSNPVHYRLMFGNEILESKRTPELVRLAEEVFNGVLFPIKLCQDKKLIRPINPYIIANVLWTMSHGISTLLIDGQMQATTAFKGLPALIQVNEISGSADIDRVFEYLGEIIANGILER